MKLLRHETDTVCNRCKADDLSEQLNTLKSSAPLISEVLMYANFHRNSASKESLVKIMCSYFNDAEIKSAKTLLYERYGSMNLLLNGQDRRSTDNRSDMMATSCDIIDDLFKLSDNGTNVVCCAGNWKRIPKVNPEAVPQVSIAEKLAQMEAKFKLYDSSLSEIRTESIKLEHRFTN